MTDSVNDKDSVLEDAKRSHQDLDCLRQDLTQKVSDLNQGKSVSMTTGRMLDGLIGRCRSLGLDYRNEVTRHTGLNTPNYLDVRIACGQMLVSLERKFPELAQ